MKAIEKKLISSFLFIGMITLGVNAKEKDIFSDEKFDSTPDLALFSDFEDASVEEEYDDFADFDSLFDEAEEDYVVEEQALPSIQTIVSNGIASAINFSGSMTADVGVGAIIADEFTPSGYFNFENIFRMKVRPSNTIALNGAITTSLGNGFGLALSYLYFDYLVFDRVYISAGKKDESLGGYTRLFTEAAVSDTSGWINIDVKYPWSTGTFTFLGAFSGFGTEPSAKDITYGMELEQTIGHTSVNIFAKKYGENIKVNDVHKHPSAGLELKRTIFGFDSYVQVVGSLANLKGLHTKAGYDRLAATAGFYKLWDANDPNVGINLEYKYIMTPTAEVQGSHLVYFQGGIKRMGKRKNLKLGLDADYNFTAHSGNMKLAFLIGDIFPYANWSNGIQISYQKGVKVQPKVASLISISLDY